MIRSIRAMLKSHLRATDGDLGRCVDFLFDDEHWTIRYMAADTGRWLRGGKVLISPTALGDWDWRSDEVPVRLSRKGIKASPPLGSDMQVSLQYEKQLAKHYGWFPYSHGPCVWSGVPSASSQTSSSRVDDIEATGKCHLRSVKEVSGYHVQALDDTVGIVDDFLVDPLVWIIRYLVVNAHRWLTDRKVLISPLWVDTIDWKRKRLSVRVNRQDIANSPVYNQRNALSRKDELALYKHYDRRPYW